MRLARIRLAEGLGRSCKQPTRQPACSPINLGPSCSALRNTNLLLSGWGKYLGDATLAAAVLDRLAANSIRLDIDGPSYRQHLARKRATEQGLEPPAAEEQA